MEGVSVTRRDHTSRGEYVAHVEGSRYLGRLTWYDDGGVRVADHTLVPPEIGGRGVAAALVEALVADARAEGFKIRPRCSYVVAAFKNHPDWADLQG